MENKVKRIFLGGSNHGKFDEENESAEPGYRNYYGEVYKSAGEIETDVGTIRIFAPEKFQPHEITNKLRTWLKSKNITEIRKIQ